MIIPIFCIGFYPQLAYATPLDATRAIMNMPSLTTDPRRHDSGGVFLVLIAAIGFSAKAIFAKFLYRYSLDATTVLSLRMIFSLPFFLAMAWWVRKTPLTTPLSHLEWLQLIGLGFIGYYLSSLFDFMGLVYISTGLERLILFLYPTLVLILSALVYKRRIIRREWFALVLCYGGILLVFVHDLEKGFGKSQHILLGSGLVFISSFTYAGYLLFSGGLIQRLGSMRFTAYAMLVSTSAVLVQFFLTHSWQAWIQRAPVYGFSLAMALLSTVLPTWLLAEGIRRIGSGRASLLGAVGPVATIFLGWLTLDEQITPYQLAGAALVLLGVFQVGKR